MYCYVVKPFIMSVYLGFPKRTKWEEIKKENYKNSVKCHTLLHSFNQDIYGGNQNDNLV